jgi:tetrahydromethanopterin S-methyltransferase subunit E
LSKYLLRAFGTLAAFWIVLLFFLVLTVVCITLPLRLVRKLWSSGAGTRTPEI